MRGRFPTHAAEERLRAVRERGGDVVPLHGTPAPALPPHVVDAVASALRRSAPAPHPRGLPELRERLAQVLGATGRAVDAERELVVTNGAMHALGLCFRSLLEPGDEVVVPAPCFFFEGPIRSAGGVPVYVPGSADDGWAWDPAALERAVGARSRALLLCNPGNPTGAVPAHEEVEAAAAVAARHGLALVTDEAYEAALWDTGLTSAFSFAEQALLVRSLGKSLLLPHLRLGVVAGPAALADGVAGALEWDVLRVGLAPQVAAIAALDGPRDWIDDAHVQLAADRLVAIDAFTSAGLRFVPPRGGPFLFVSDGRPELGASLAAAGIAAVDGEHFQATLWARVPFGGAARAAAELAAGLVRWTDARGHPR
jgi:aspartate/methionine/tyrosine aminotransferase